MTPPTSPRNARRRFLRTLGTVGTLAVAGCLGTDRGGPRVVEMVATDFAPAALTVAPGTTVRWVNESDVDHTVTAYGDRIPAAADYFASGGFDAERAARNDVIRGFVVPGERYDHSFETPGTYDYCCIPHESSGMTGTVRVR